MVKSHGFLIRQRQDKGLLLRRNLETIKNEMFVKKKKKKKP